MATKAFGATVSEYLSTRFITDANPNNTEGFPVFSHQEDLGLPFVFLFFFIFLHFSNYSFTGKLSKAQQQTK
jgi:hypothetical protein